MFLSLHNFTATHNALQTKHPRSYVLCVLKVQHIIMSGMSPGLGTAVSRLTRLAGNNIVVCCQGAALSVILRIKTMHTLTKKVSAPIQESGWEQRVPRLPKMKSRTLRYLERKTSRWQPCPSE